ncbi:hypothetical protein C6I20_05640 [Aeromicrobium sp. A1-2]|uniref:DUF3040 domain-containing protein n=1 Tax=Aeromicrobium sp. A1-2 TaxID=2107713 RepID=UPI000E512AB7|nr:DUF3040 domain-containing protein [Aeromicrobium sp. A1-2]AXT84726.1 hypothetical protein C6I20_05640 [Aeromicrobium sp. A1-2]
MPLSDEEARLLHQLEQSLAAEDPDFASTLRGSKFMARNRRVAVLAILGFLGGIVLLFAGAVSAMTWLGVVGFVAMLGAAYLFMNAWKRGIGGRDEEPAASSPSKPGSSKQAGTFVDRMEERWQRRQDGDDR